MTCDFFMKSSRWTPQFARKFMVRIGPPLKPVATFVIDSTMVRNACEVEISDAATSIGDLVKVPGKHHVAVICPDDGEDSFDEAQIRGLLIYAAAICARTGVAALSIALTET